MVTGSLQQFTIEDYPFASDLMRESWNYSTIGITYDEKDPYFSSNNTGGNAKKYKLLTFVIQVGSLDGTSSFSTVSIGKTDMYEITQPMAIKGITFPYGVPNSIQINVCSYSKEEEE